MIEQNKISQISNKTQQNGGKKIPESVIERDYCLSWLLFGLAQLDSKKKLFLKAALHLDVATMKTIDFLKILIFH